MISTVGESLTRRILLKVAATAAVGAEVSGRVVDLPIRRQAVSLAGREATAGHQ